MGLPNSSRAVTVAVTLPPAVTLFDERVNVDTVGLIVALFDTATLNVPPGAPAAWPEHAVYAPLVAFR